MSENDSTQMFAYGTTTTDSPHFEQTCECPILKAFGRQPYPDEQTVAKLYDEVCRDWYGLAGQKGNIPEKWAREAWSEVIESTNGFNEKLAKDVATDLGWNDLAE
jgi:hypothetical protein